jgi:hypothetical protein
MKSIEPEVNQPIFDATVTEIDGGCTGGIDKKSYTQPVLTRYGKVSKLTAAVTGSNTDTLGGNQV